VGYTKIIRHLVFSALSLACGLTELDAIYLPGFSPVFEDILKARLLNERVRFFHAINIKSRIPTKWPPVLDKRPKSFSQPEASYADLIRPRLRASQTWYLDILPESGFGAVERLVNGLMADTKTRVEHRKLTGSRA
jgi:hypothetical protein